MSAEWIEGRFEGIYSGPRRWRGENPSKRGHRRQRGADDEIRRFGFEIESGQLHDVTPCRAPSAYSHDDGHVIRQDRVRRIRLSNLDHETGQENSDRETSLFDVHISDFQLKHPAESGERAYGTIIGTLRARRRPVLDQRTASSDVPTREPDRVIDQVDASEAKSRPDGTKHDRLNESTHEHVVVEGVSPGWALVLSLLWIAFGIIAYAYGLRNALLWAAPIAASLGLLRATHGGIVRGAPWWLAAMLPAIQIAVLVSPLELAWQSGCMPKLGILILSQLSLPILLAAVIGSRGALWVTGAIWTAVLVASFATPDPETCLTPHTEGPIAESAAQPTQPRPRRTDENGRWPVMPPIPGPGIAPHSGSSPGAGPIPSTGSRNLSGSPGSASEALFSGNAARPTHPGHVDPIGSGDPHLALDNGSVSMDPEQTDTTIMNTESPSQPTREGNRTRGLSQVEGGWLSPDHRRAPREHVLISIEQANRTPSLFFDSGGVHRVYVPTDPLFEDGSSILRRDAQLVLARVAALLSLPSRPPVLLEVHSDSSGTPESQIELSRRRADGIRSWLIDRGHVKPSRFEIQPVGGTRPLVPPDGDFGAQQPNRRIEIRLRKVQRRSAANHRAE